MKGEAGIRSTEVGATPLRETAHIAALPNVSQVAVPVQAQPLRDVAGHESVAFGRVQDSPAPAANYNAGASVARAPEARPASSDLTGLHRVINVPAVECCQRFLCPLVVSCTFALSVVIHPVGFVGHHALLALLSFLISIAAFEHLDLFADWRTFHLNQLARTLVVASLSVVATVFGISVVAGHEYRIPTSVVFLWLLILPFGLLGSVKLGRVLVRRAIRAGHLTRTAVVIGMNEPSRRFVERVQSHPYTGIQICACFEDRAAPRRVEIPTVPVVNGIAQAPEYVRRNNIDTIYVALPMVGNPRQMALINQLRDTTASIYFLPDLFSFGAIQMRMHAVADVATIAVCESPLRGLGCIAKRLLDLSLTLAVIALGWPLLLGCAAGVKLSSPGGILFKQRRYGLDGREIVIYKFRSMVVCEDGPTIAQARRSDPRVTRFGAFLRKTSLDELPQLFNVINGSMSLVGPRPHAVAHNEQYRKLINGYMVRHKVKPGITGWAQVNGYRGEIDSVDKMQLRVQHDIDYLRNWSIWLDLWIMLRTLPVVFSRKGAF
jgi:putative colanic acid biosynthesis UDP-glucose lipid carrier transferase